MSEHGEGSEIIIGAESTQPQEQKPPLALQSSDEPVQESKSGLSRLMEKLRSGAKKGYDYIDAGVTPKEIPVDEITEQKVAEAIKGYRIEVGRFKKYDPEYVEMPFSIPNILTELGYLGNWQAGTTDWKKKHTLAYDKVRKGIDGLVRSGALSTIQGPEQHPDNESVWYKIEKENDIRSASKGPVEDGNK